MNPLNAAIIALNLPHGVIEIYVALTWVWVVTAVIVGFIVFLIKRILSL